MPELALRPEHTNLRGSYPYDSPETSFGRGLRPVLDRAMGDALIAEAFDPEQAIAEIKLTLRQQVHEVLAHAISEEQSDWSRDLAHSDDWRSKTETHPILAVLGAPSPEEIPDIGDLTVGEEYFLALDKQLDQRGSFGVLQSIREHPQMQQSILPFIRGASSRLQRAEEHGIDDVFWHARNESVGNPGLVLPPQKFSDLYILTFLPRDLRCCVQQTLVRQSVRQGLANLARGNRKDPTATEFFRLLGEYYRLGSQLHRHWSELIEKYGASDDVFHALNEDRIAHMQVLEDIAVLHREHGCGRQFYEHEDVLQRAFSGIEQMDHDCECTEWQLTDIGHGFDFDTYDLYKIQSSNKEEIASKKTLGNACIFEDDPVQSEHYRMMIENSRYTLSQGSKACSSSASDILALAQDPEVRMFLIDIEQEADPYAGMRLAEQVLRSRAEQYRSLTADQIIQDHEKTRIVVWTRSIKKMREAFEYFDQLKANLNKQWKSEKGRDLVYGMHGGSSLAPIILEVKMKNEDPF